MNETLLSRLLSPDSIERRSAERTSPLVVPAVGSGQVTKAAVEAGADGLLALSAGVYRHHGAGSLASFLASGNANEQTQELLKAHCLPGRGNVPVFAGVLAGDPTQEAGAVFARLKGWGVEGVINWPAVGFVDGQFREAMEEAGCGLSGEVEMLTEARREGFATLGFALADVEVRAFVEAGVHGLVLNLGLTPAESELIDRRDQVQAAVVRLRALLVAASQTARRCGRPMPLCLAFGGPVLTPEDGETVFRQTEIDGFAGGSVFERLPVRGTVAAAVRGFKSVHRRTAGAEATPARGLGELLGRSRPMREVFHQLQRVGPVDINVCLAGETGTGKELAAAALHRLSERREGPLVTVNCGAIPDSLLESELFGHEKGAFTGAHRRRPGKFELANGGTLFLDEVGDLSAHGQVALLRALQQREVTRVGGDAPLPVDVRVVTATHRDLPALVAAGEFRADLFYRLNEFTIMLPPLRERTEDLPELVDAFLKELSDRVGRRLVGLTAEFHEKLRAHAWPGNVRELRHVLAQAALREEGAVLTGDGFVPADFPAAPRRQADTKPTPLPKGPAAACAALSRAAGNKAAAARALGVTRKTLYAWLSAVEPEGKTDAALAR
jgi:two-component system response regulator HydG